MLLYINDILLFINPVSVLALLTELLITVMKKRTEAKLVTLDLSHSECIGRHRKSVCIVA